MPRGVADAEFVEDVRVGEGEVGDHDLGEQQPLVHRLVDDAAAALLVGADHLDAAPSAAAGLIACS